jgi:DNA-binding transcriptional ArsR family regulator
LSKPIELWLNIQRNKQKAEQALQILRQAGLVMSQERQSSWLSKIQIYIKIGAKNEQRHRILSNHI